MTGQQRVWRAGGAAAGACGWAWLRVPWRAPLRLPHPAHTLTFHAHARARCTRTRTCTGAVARLSELKASTPELLDVFLDKVSSALGGKPFTSSGLYITRNEGDELLCQEGAVAKVNALISAVGSGITGSQAQARGGAFCVC